MALAKIIFCATCVHNYGCIRMVFCRLYTCVYIFKKALQFRTVSHNTFHIHVNVQDIIKIKLVM